MTPPVFVDVISSDENCDSDDTDPTVQHLFYSPNTPRLPEGESASNDIKRPRKRPREAAAAASGAASVAVQETTSVTAATYNGASAAVSHTRKVESTGISSSFSIEPPPPPSPPEGEEALGFSLLNASNSTNGTSAHADPAVPFQYFSARTAALSAAKNPVLDEVLHIRACIKSVAGFQFNTGLYELKVVIEDCTETKEVAVDAKFVEKLMGVPCLEFMRAMHKTPQVAHQWAARMQFALMTLEGVMEFRMNPNGTFTLLDCRDVSLQDAHTLLQRVKASLHR